MNQFYKRALDAVAKEAIGAAGRYAGNYLLDSLTKEGQDKPDTPIVSETADGKVNVSYYPDLRMQPGQSEKSFRKGAEDLTPRFTRDKESGSYKDLPEGFGIQTMLGPIVDNPVDAAVFAKNIAPYAGMAVAGTALHAMFGGKPSSEYKVPVTPRSYVPGGRVVDPGSNQNVLASNVSTANEAYLMNLKQQHAIDLIYAKQQARTPGVQDYGSALGSMSSTGDIPSELAQYQALLQSDLDKGGRPAINEEAKEIARALYGTGLKAF